MNGVDITTAAPCQGIRVVTREYDMVMQWERSLRRAWPSWLNGFMCGYLASGKYDNDRGSE